MKVYKVELLVFDFDELGEKEIISELERAKYSCPDRYENCGR